MERRSHQHPEQEPQHTPAERYLLDRLAYTDRTQGNLKERFHQTGKSQLILLSRRLGIAEYSAPLPPVSEPEDKFERELKTAVFGSRLALLNEALRRETNYSPDGTYTRPTFAPDSPVGELHDLVEQDQEGLTTQMPTGEPAAAGLSLSTHQRAVVAELVARAGVKPAQVPTFLPLERTRLTRAAILTRLNEHSRAIAAGQVTVAGLMPFVGTTPAPEQP